MHVRMYMFLSFIDSLENSQVIEQPLKDSAFIDTSIVHEKKNVFNEASQTLNSGTSIDTFSLSQENMSETSQTLDIDPLPNDTIPTDTQPRNGIKNDPDNVTGSIENDMQSAHNRLAQQTSALFLPDPPDPNNLANTQSDNPLPVAAINVNMINGQPVYTIQLMGHSIPLAAITIPTSDGPLQLQSSGITTQSLNKPNHELLSIADNPTVSDTETPLTDPSSPGSPSSTSRFALCYLKFSIFMFLCFNNIDIIQTRSHIIEQVYSIAFTFLSVRLNRFLL